MAEHESEAASEPRQTKPPLPSSTLTKTEIPVFDLRALMGDAREAVLVHAGERYRLRITAKDKLILTK